MEKEPKGRWGCFVFAREPLLATEIAGDREGHRAQQRSSRRILWMRSYFVPDMVEKTVGEPAVAFLQARLRNPILPISVA